MILCIHRRPLKRVRPRGSIQSNQQQCACAPDRIRVRRLHPGPGCERERGGFPMCVCVEKKKKKKKKRKSSSSRLAPCRRAILRSSEGATCHRPERHLRILAWKRNPPRRAGEDVSVIPPSIERSMLSQRTAGARHQSSSLRSL